MSALPLNQGPVSAARLCRLWRLRRLWDGHEWPADDGAGCLWRHATNDAAEAGALLRFATNLTRILRAESFATRTMASRSVMRSLTRALRSSRPVRGFRALGTSRILQDRSKIAEALKSSPASMKHQFPADYHIFEDADLELLHNLGIHTEWVQHNARPGTLYDEALRYEKGSAILSTGALAAFSGAKTGRSPLDKRVVLEESTENDVWWGPVNVPLSENTFKINRERAIDYLNTRERLYVFDGFAGWDPDYRYKIRVITSRAYHALFMHNMLIRPTEEELLNFGEPDYTIYNGGAFPANRATDGMTSGTSVSLNFKTREVVILGTQYAGEMKKGVFTIMNYLLPKRGILSMHASANEGKAGDVTIFFGLSGTGKTTLSADENRLLIGDDEHAWTDKGIFNIEGGCYAKAQLSEDQRAQ
eukprot:s4107_g2.t1